MVDDVGVSRGGWGRTSLLPPQSEGEERAAPRAPLQPDRTFQLILKNRVGSLSGTKAEIFECVRRQPGQVITAIAEHVGCSHNNAARHLDRLCDMGLLVREKEGRGVRHYCPFQHNQEARLEPYMQDPKKRRVVEHMGLHPDQEWNVNALAREVGVYHTFLLRLLKRLERRGLVELYRPGARYYTRATRQLAQLVRESVETRQD